jgi:3,4-dihydroxy 2-butanone 4-phosphate synthase/GTP cyclohydrolase II
MNSIPELVEDIRAGKMVILMDDEDRENEGDLIMAAELVRPEDINFMARYGRGLICLTLTKERCQQLNLPLMVSNNGARYSTNFTLSIEAAEGVTTGISAADRAHTVRTAVKPDARPSDLVQPGHIFPLMAQPGGVLNRAGHTEAGCDLARLAGLEPAAVIVEILNDDGTMARRPDLERFAEEHGLKIGTIADLIEYRSLNEKTVEALGACNWPTPFGDFRLHSFRDTIDGQMHFALVMGDIKPDAPTLVRVHMSDFLVDQLQGRRDKKPSWTIEQAMKRVAQEGHGVVVVLSGKDSRENWSERVRRWIDEDSGQSQLRTNPQAGRRTVGIGSQILTELGVHKMRLMSEEKHYYALSGFKLEVVEYVTNEE